MTWEEFDNEIVALAAKIDLSPDVIVGIVRGGLVPARLLSKHLKVKDMYCLTVKKGGDKRKITSEVLEDLTNKKIIIIEDILETGKSLIVAKKYLESKGAFVKTACLYILPVSKIKPDFYLKEISEAIDFPWE